MPQMDGYETIKASAREPALRRAADHRRDREGDAGRPREEHRAGASDYITKPVDPDKLLSLVGAWLSLEPGVATTDP